MTNCKEFVRNCILFKTLLEKYRLNIIWTEFQVTEITYSINKCKQGHKTPLTVTEYNAFQQNSK